jgi:hypothetical protein
VGAREERRLRLRRRTRVCGAVPQLAPNAPRLPPRNSTRRPVLDSSCGDGRGGRERVSILMEFFACRGVRSDVCLMRGACAAARPAPPG